MRHVFEREVRGCPLVAELLWAGDDLQVCIRGGERPHIGSVTVAVQDETGVTLKTWRGVHHRDDVIGEIFAQALAERTGATVCVSCGVHYDVLPKAEIAAVVEEARFLLNEILFSL